jgi:hypothetical protein
MRSVVASWETALGFRGAYPAEGNELADNQILESSKH